MGSGAVKVVGVTMVKDEMDVLPYTLPRMMQQLDHVVVADNCSSDGTLAYLLKEESINGPWLTLIPDYEPAYLQSQKMTSLAQMARDDFGADWVVPFDADEVWHVEGSSLRDHFTDSQWSVELAILFDHVATAADNFVEPDPVVRMTYRRFHPLPLPKVAFRPLPGFVIEMGNHGVRYPGMVGTQRDSGITVHHYPYRSADQMARKASNGARAYELAGDRVPPGAGQHWRDYGRFYETGGLDAIREIFETWFYSSDPAHDELLVNDPCPVTL